MGDAREDEPRVYSLAEVDAAAEELLAGWTSEEEAEPSRWHRVGQLALRVGRKFRTEDANGNGREGIVLEVDDDTATVQFLDEDEPSVLQTSRLQAAKEYAVDHKRDGAIVSGVIGVSVMGLFAYFKSRR